LFKSAQTWALPAGKITSPVIVIAMNVPFQDKRSRLSSRLASVHRQHFATSEKYQDVAVLSFSRMTIRRFYPVRYSKQQRCKSPVIFSWI
jgi:hypothetical protein